MEYRVRVPFSLTIMILAGFLTACTVPDAPRASAPKASAPLFSAAQSARMFAEVVRTVEPVAERECRLRTKNVDCDFDIVVDNRPNQPANAYQTLDRNDRPIIAFTTALIGDARNADELAFIMGHEAAHHIGGHIARQEQHAVAGAVLAGGLAVLLGGNSDAVQTAQRTGAQVGARQYSKNFELEADELGTIITARAGYDPLRGAAFFSRIPDPGDRFLGTHPPNAARVETVRRTAGSL